MAADLHVHTSFSDGTASPQAVVQLAKNVGLKTIALTDHDTIAGIAAGIKSGQELAVDVIPGIEFTTEACNTEVHILGYFIDCDNLSLQAAISKIQADREQRISKICDKLRNLGVELAPETVFQIAGHRGAGRPHVARALVEAGVVTTFKEAFNRYLDIKGPAYVSHYKLLPEEAVRLIRTAGGVPVYGHPAVSNCDQIIPDLIAAGLMGIEAYYSGQNRSQTRHYLGLAEKYALLVTGGSDYHGEKSGREINLGEFTIPDELVDKLKQVKK